MRWAHVDGVEISFFFGLEKKYTEKVIFKREIDIEIVVCFIGTCLLNVLGNQQ